MKQPQTQIPPIRLKDENWARDPKAKAQAFAEHLMTVFQPYPPDNAVEDEIKINEYLEAPFQMDFPIKKFNCNEVK